MKFLEMIFAIAVIEFFLERRPLVGDPL